MFTLGNWVLFGFMIITLLAILFIVYTESYDNKENTLITLAFGTVIIGAIMGIIAWYNISTASGNRALKDYQINIQKGIEREIVITAEDGREIFRYDGKIDIESDHKDNYIKFDDENGKRYIIYYGIQDTITIIDK